MLGMSSTIEIYTPLPSIRVFVVVYKNPLPGVDVEGNTNPNKILSAAEWLI